MTCFSLAELTERAGARLRGDGNILITGLAPLNSAQPGQISFLDNPSYKQYLAATKASAVIISSQYADDCPTAALIVDNPYLTYAKIANLFIESKALLPGIHPSAQIDSTATIAKTAKIGANCIIGANALIGEQVIIEPNCYIGDNTIIGSGSYLAPRVTIYRDTKIGQRVIIHSGATIASDGFGYANENGKWYKVPQLGGVIIGDEVEIGANTCIDRGALNDTIIGNGVKLDNLIQVAHNVVIGDHTAIAACVAIAGSTKIGRYCMIGGCSAIGGHLEIVDKVYLTGRAMVSHSIRQPGVYSSCTGLQPNKEWHKSVARFRQLDKIARKVTEIDKQLAKKRTSDD